MLVLVIEMGFDSNKKSCKESYKREGQKREGGILSLLRLFACVCLTREGY